MIALDTVINTCRDKIYQPTEELVIEARAELSQLRADVARLTQERDEARKEMADFDAHHRKVYTAYEQAQAAVNEARDLIDLSAHFIKLVEEYYGRRKSADELMNDLRTWLAAHPTPDNHVHLANRSGGYCVIFGKPTPEAEK